MMGIMLVLALLLSQVFVIIYSVKIGYKQPKLQLDINAAFIIITLILAIAKIISIDLRIIPLLVLLFIQILFNAKSIFKPTTPEKLRLKKYIFLRFLRLLLYFVFTIPILIFPYYKPIVPTGDFQVLTSIYTWEDRSRYESFTEAPNDYRNITVQFWYPKTNTHESTNNRNEKYPLIIFSHGLGTLRGSNLSCFKDLASNGYVVCSIDH